MTVSISGCSAYLNSMLNYIGMPLVFECSGVGRVDDLTALRAAALEAARRLGDALGIADLRPIYTGRELIGRAYDLYTHRLIIGTSEVGQLRLVTLKGVFVNISGVLYTNGLPFVEPSTLEKLTRGQRVSEGENLGIRYASKACPDETPVGQKEIPRFVIYSAEGVIPHVDVSVWRLKLRGPNGNAALTFDDLKAISRDLGTHDFHCVTGWSVKRRRYYGVMLDELLEKHLGGLGNANWIIATTVSGYSSVIPASMLGSTAVILGIDSDSLSPEGGYPARLFNPELYGWKGAKWLSSIELLEDYVDGYWEALGYHERGLVAMNERFKIRNPELEVLCP